MRDKKDITIISRIDLSVIDNFEKGFDEACRMALNHLYSSEFKSNIYNEDTILIAPGNNRVQGELRLIFPNYYLDNVDIVYDSDATGKRYADYRFKFYRIDYPANLFYKKLIKKAISEGKVSQHEEIYRR